MASSSSPSSLESLQAPTAPTRTTTRQPSTSRRCLAATDTPMMVRDWLCITSVDTPSTRSPASRGTTANTTRTSTSRPSGSGTRHTPMDKKIAVTANVTSDNPEVIARAAEAFTRATTGLALEGVTTVLVIQEAVEDDG